MDEVSGAPRPGTTLALAAPTCAPVARRFLSSFRSTLPTGAFHLRIHRCLQLNISQTELISTPVPVPDIGTPPNRLALATARCSLTPAPSIRTPLLPSRPFSSRLWDRRKGLQPAPPPARFRPVPSPAPSEGHSDHSKCKPHHVRNSLLQRSWWCQPNVWPRAGCLSLASSPQSVPRSPYANRNEPLRVL